MRTILLQDLKRKLSAVNRNFSHGLFITEQFLIDNKRLIAGDQAGFSGDIFVENSFSKQFNYKMSDLAAAIDEYRKETFVSFYILAYTSLEVYTSNVSDLTAAILSATPPNDKSLTTKGDINRNLEKALIMAGSSWIATMGSQEQHTLDYIRLRRNTLVHNEGNVSLLLKDLIRDHGLSLNAYWRDEGVALRSTDFTVLPTRVFSAEEIIDEIILLREISERFDNRLLHTIGRPTIINYIVDQFKKEYTKEIKQKSKDRVINMLLARANREFGLDRHDINVTTIRF